jgi:hypothetical protein
MPVHDPEICLVVVCDERTSNQRASRKGLCGASNIACILLCHSSRSVSEGNCALLLVDESVAQGGVTMFPQKLIAKIDSGKKTHSQTFRQLGTLAHSIEIGGCV